MSKYPTKLTVEQLTTIGITDIPAIQTKWREFINAGGAKKKQMNHYGSWSKGSVYNYIESDLRAVHHLLYLLVTGKDASTGFHNDQAYWETCNLLKYSYSVDLEAFGGTVTSDMLGRLRLILVAK